MHYVNADNLMQTDRRTSAEQWLDAELVRRGALEQGAEPGSLLRAVALELAEKLRLIGHIEAEERRHLWDGSPMPNYVITSSAPRAEGNAEVMP